MALYMMWSVLDFSDILDVIKVPLSLGISGFGGTSITP